jgi:predicted nucleotidyltransferase
MHTRKSLALPAEVSNFLRDAGGALADRLVGAIVFGSWAAGNPSEQSDLDLAIIVSDADAERSRQEVYHALRVSEVDHRKISLSIETYLRLKEFLKLGDPFAWVVCRAGVVVEDSKSLLRSLQQECTSRTETFNRQAVSAYLRRKGEYHCAQAMHSASQLLSSIQLSMMASAQAVVVSSSSDALGPDDLVRSADWPTVKAEVAKNTMGKEEIALIESLVMAHKATSTKSEFLGRDLMESLDAAANLWRRLAAGQPVQGVEKPPLLSTAGQNANHWAPGFGTTPAATGPSESEHDDR